MSLYYVAIGDSLSAGIGTSLFSPGFVQRYRRMAERELEEPVYVQTIARPGYQTSDILSELENESTADQIQQAELITITAGENDFIQAVRKYQQDRNRKDYYQNLKTSMQNYSKIIKRVIVLKQASEKPYLIRLVNLYNPFPDEMMADNWIKNFNRLPKDFSLKMNVKYVQIEKVIGGSEKEYIALDGIHPNDIGYERIAESLHHLGYDELHYGLEEE